MSGVATAALIAGGIGAAGSLGGAALESSAAGKAAKTQANAAEQAAQLQGELGQEQLGYENYQYQQGRADEQPYLQAGDNGLASLSYLLGLNSPNSTTAGGTGSGSASTGSTLSIPGINGSVSIPGVQNTTGVANTNLGAFGSLLAPYSGGSFQAPTAAQAAASPGEQFALQQGENAVQAGAAANGSLLTGGTQAALNNYAQGVASTNYNNVYNQALQAYNTNYNVWSNQQANTYNRLASLAGMGQTTAQQLSNLGLNTSNQVSNTLGNAGREIGQDYQNAGAATASGYVGSANAWAGGLNSLGQLGQLGLLSSLLKPSASGGWTTDNGSGPDDGFDAMVNV